MFSCECKDVCYLCSLFVFRIADTVVHGMKIEEHSLDCFGAEMRTFSELHRLHSCVQWSRGVRASDVGFHAWENFCRTGWDFITEKRKDSITDVVHTDFPISARLVIPGCSKNNYRHISDDWKNSTQDLSDLQGAAYIVGQRNKTTG